MRVVVPGLPAVVAAFISTFAVTISVTITLNSALGGSAQAATVTVFDRDRAGFLANSTGLRTETFDHITTDTDYFPSAVDVGDFSLLMTEQTPGTITFANLNAPPNATDIFPGDSGTYVNASTIAENQPDGWTRLVLTFEFPIHAFGLDLHNWNDVDVPRNAIDLNNGASVDFSQPDSPVNFANGDFLGLVSDTPFTEVTFRTLGGGGDGFNFDNVVYGFPVPAGGAAGLVMLGVLGAVCQRRNGTMPSRSTSRVKSQA